jgi:homopolymeric O-antigen transport system permease protein
VLQRLRDVAAYRELLRNLVVRDLKVRYRNSFFGFLWALGNPLLMMGVFTIVFTVLWPQDVAKFPVFILAGLLPWNFFSSSVMGSITSITGNAHIVKKVFFPREILPASLVLSNLVNFCLALVALFIVIILFQVKLTVWLLLLPLVIIVQAVFTLGVAFFLSAINVSYRDTEVIMDVVVLALFFLTPVFYPIERLPQSFVAFGFDLPVQRLMYIWNPMASLIASYRSILYGSYIGGPPGPPGLDFFLRTTATALVFFVAGYAFFAHRSRRFGEEV